MIVAAIPQPLRRMPIFGLALEIIAKDQKIPESIAQEVDKILAAAIRLFSQDGNVMDEISSESINLAIRLKFDVELKNELDSFSDIRSVTSQRASKVLRAMESNLAQIS